MNLLEFDNHDPIWNESERALIYENGRQKGLQEGRTLCFQKIMITRVSSYNEGIKQGAKALAKELEDQAIIYISPDLRTDLINAIERQFRNSIVGE